MLVGRELVVSGRHHRDDLVILAHHKGDALDKAMADFHAAHILAAGAGRRDVQIIGFGDIGAFIRGDGEFAGAEIRIGGKLVQPVQIVGGNPDDSGAGGVELVRIFGEGMGFQVAAAGVGGGIEIDHRRAFLQRVVKIEGEILAAQAGGGGEIGRGVADLEGGESGQAQMAAKSKAKHDGSS